MYHRAKNVLFALLAASSVSAIALPNDRDLPIQMYSDNYTQDVARGITSYIGNANIEQGALKIQADRIDVSFVDRQVVKVVAIGQPAVFVDQPDETRGEVLAQGNRVEFLVESNTVVVIGDAKFEHDGSQVSASEIEFDLDAAAATAKGGVRHVIQPPTAEADAEETP